MTNEIAVAEKLLQVAAVKLSPNDPFTWASGWKSPIYCDNRKVLSFPYVRDFIKSEMCNVIFEKFGEAETLAGVATAGIPWGAMAADQLKLTPEYMKEFGLVDEIVAEPVGGAHRSPSTAIDALGAAIGKSLDSLSRLTRDQVKHERRQKFLAMGGL